VVTNTPILTDCVSLLGGMLGALFMSGSLALLRRYRRRLTHRLPQDEQVIEPVVFRPVDDRAELWTRTNHSPETRLVARKVELASRLMNQRRIKRWSR
jgi:hypothetical protein